MHIVSYKIFPSKKRMRSGERNFKRLKSSEIKKDVPLSSYTTFGVGGKAEFFCIVEEREDLLYLLRWRRDSANPFLVLGGGSNILIRDQGVRGLVIKLGEEFKDLRCEGRRITAGGGVSLKKLLEYAKMNYLSGLETLSGIPGTVGGAAVMNAGTSQGSIGDSIYTVEVMDEEGKKVFLRERLDFFYRGSSIKSGEVVVGVEFDLKIKEKEEIKSLMRKNFKEKKKSQPLNFPSAGCIFKNPKEASAGKLIEEAGLKGLKRGGASISILHANFIVNMGGATSDDILYLINVVKEKVYKKFGILLEEEIRIV